MCRSYRNRLTALLTLLYGGRLLLPSLGLCYLGLSSVSLIDLVSSIFWPFALPSDLGSPSSSEKSCPSVHLNVTTYPFIATSGSPLVYQRILPRETYLDGKFD